MFLESRLSRSLSLASRIIFKYSNDVVEAGQKLVEIGADELVDGGFWILPLNEMGKQFFSPNFKLITGYCNLEKSADFYSIV